MEIPYLAISLVANGLFVIVIVAMALIISGFMKSHQSMVAGYKRRNLTGRDREEIRRRLLAKGITDVHPHEVLDLIYTFRAVELGQYSDEDPYIPEDPYSDVDDYESGKGA